MHETYGVSSVKFQRCCEHPASDTGEVVISEAAKVAGLVNVKVNEEKAQFVFKLISRVELNRCCLRRVSDHKQLGLPRVVRPMNTLYTLPISLRCDVYEGKTTTDIPILFKVGFITLGRGSLGCSSLNTYLAVLEIVGAPTLHSVLQVRSKFLEAGSISSPY